MFTEEELSQLKEIIKDLAMEKQYFSLDEAASYIGIAKQTLYHHTHQGNISFYKPNGKLIVFKKEDLDKWLEQHRIPSNQELINGNILHHKNK